MESWQATGLASPKEKNIMAKAQDIETIRVAFVASAAEASPAKILGAVTRAGRDATKAAAIAGAEANDIKKKDPAKWAHQMNTAAALMALVWEDGADLDKDTVADDCIVRAKASSKSTGACKAKGSGDTLVGAVTRLIEEKDAKAARADIRKARGTGRGGKRGPKDQNATPALVRAVDAKIEAFKKAHKDQSPTVNAKAQELIQALRLLEEIEEKATGAMVTLEMAAGE